MYQINNFTNNDDVKLLDSMGPFTVIEYQKDLSVMPGSAQLAYYCNAMNVRKRQVICDLSKANITLQAGAMQWTVGNVNATTGVKGVGDLFGKALRGSVTGESAIKPEYTGDGTLVLEPTYKHILLLDLADWNGSIVLDDGLFLACDSKLKHKAVMRSNFSSAVVKQRRPVQPGHRGQRRGLPGVLLSQGGAGGDHPSGRRAEGGWQHGHRLERQPEFHRGALRQIPGRLRRLRRGSGQCLPRHGPGAAGPCAGRRGLI